MMSQAITYSKVSQVQTNDGLKLLSKLCPQKGMTILDMGCGTGYLSSILADHVGPNGSVLAVDPDNERIRVAMETYGGIDNLRFIEGSTDTFPVEEQQFDLVFSNYVLHWVSDKEGAFKRIYKSLKPGGKFAFNSTLTHHVYFDEMISLMDNERKNCLYSHFHYIPPEQYESIAVMSCNFIVLFKDVFVSRDKFENIDALMDFYFAVTHGEFDPKLADKNELDQFKQKFGDEPVEAALETGNSMILQK